MRDKLSLNGDWQFGYCPIKTGGISSMPALDMTCPVPGDVHIPFINAGIIKEPLVDLNSKDADITSNNEFWYRRSFNYTKTSESGISEIVFEGLDCTADIWINDHYIGSHNNSFVEAVFDITDYLTDGENDVTVRIDSGMAACSEKPLYDMYKMWNGDQPYRSWMRKPQFVYGWDWTIPLETCGLWKDVYICTYKQAVIRDMYCHPANDAVPTEHSEHLLRIETECQDINNCDIDKIVCTVYGDERFSDCAIVNQAEYKYQSDSTVSITIPDAHLWWSNGLGKPYLYKIKIQLISSDNTVLDEMTRNYGIKSISISEETLNENESAFTFILNGIPVFCKGANHVPCDCLIGRITEEKERAHVKLAHDANMNMLRVWGGGTYSSDTFMNECDKCGIMVWHDFMFACGYYPDFDSEYMANVLNEAVLAVKRLRNYTCLIGWSGNNEVQEMYAATKAHSPHFEWYGGKIYEELLPQVVNQYCNGLIYRQSSPFGGENPADIERGDQHIWHFTHRPNFKHYLDLARFTDFNVKFLSEFGIIGAMNIESVRKCITDEHIDRNSEVWKHHCNTSSSHDILDMVLGSYFDNVSSMPLQEYILKSQAVQAELMRYIYDEFRSRKFVCSGLLFWTLGDSFGINNWAILDYYMDKRPIYYYLKRSNSDVSITVKGYSVQNFEGMKNYRNYFCDRPEPIEIWINNDTLVAGRYLLKCKVMTFNGAVCYESQKEISATPNSAVHVADIDLSSIIFNPDETFLHAELLCDNEVISENRYFFAPFKNLMLNSAQISCNIEKISDNSAKLTLCSDTFVWMLHIGDTDVISVSDNDFDLLPNCPKTVVVNSSDIDRYMPKLLSPGADLTAIINTGE